MFRRTNHESCRIIPTKYAPATMALITKYASTMAHIIKVTSLLRILGFCFVLFNGTSGLYAQVPVDLTPNPKLQLLDNNGQPLAGGCVFTYATGTSTPLATYSESTGTNVNANPTIADGGGRLSIWLQNQSYRIQVWGNGGVNGNGCASGFMLYSVDGVVSKGLQALTSGAVILAPPGRANQTIAGPLTADQFNGPVSQLLPSITVKTATNNPTINTTNPASAGQIYNVPDPLTPTAHFLLDAGATNTLDCTDGIITCKRTGTYYFPGASCNAGIAASGWDTFASSFPVATCFSGTNTVRGQLGMPGAYAHLQSNIGTNSATTTVTTTYPSALITGDLLVLSVAFNGTTTITGCTDGTNAYSQTKHVTNAALSVDIWVFHNATTKPAGTTLTCTFAGAASSALKWHEYLVATTTSVDVTASNSGTGTAVTSGTTGSTAQATELVFAAAGDLAVPSLVPSTSGYDDHLVTNNATTVQVDDAGVIQQAIATQAAGFTLGTSQAWAAAIVTFKATNAGLVNEAQRTIVLPAFFNAAQPVAGLIRWTNPFVAIGTAQAVLGLQYSCSPDGVTDDPPPALGGATPQNVSTTSAGILTTTTLSTFTPTGCAAGNTIHVYLVRSKYTLLDTYEGMVNVVGVTVSVGINQ